MPKTNKYHPIEYVGHEYRAVVLHNTSASWLVICQQYGKKYASFLIDRKIQGQGDVITQKLEQGQSIDYLADDVFKEV